MAGQGKKEFSDGEVLSAADVNGYLMDQSVMRFADSTARTAAIGTPTEGMVSYLDDTNDVEVYDGSGWVNFTGDITNITAGTGLTGGGSEGAVTLSADFTSVQENLITTEGDLYVGGSGGTATRLGIGAADTVLTSDGTAISWGAGGGGGGQNFVKLPANKLSTIDVSFPADSVVRFALITTSTSNLEISALDSSDNVIDTFNVARDTPFTFVTQNVEVTKLSILQDIAQENVILVFNNPLEEADPASSFGVAVITSSQSITIDSNHTAYVLGAGGGGGGCDRLRGSGGGGGSGYLAIGTLAAGTYTASIGAGGTGSSGPTGTASAGGTTEIGAISALGGSGGQSEGQTRGGNGGSGGSGGGGGASTNIGSTVPAAENGSNGGDGEDGTSVNNNEAGTGGSGSGVLFPSNTTVVSLGYTPGISKSNNTPSGLYAGGEGGGILSAYDSGADADGFGAGGNGANGDDGVTNGNVTGGDGFQGFILLIEE